VRVKEGKKMTTENYEFELMPETEMPNTTYQKGSKYDPILDKFLASGIKIVSIKPKAEEDANYMRTQIKKRLDKRKMNDKITASVVNNKVYLQIPTPKVEEKK
jgi:hypothetical protein